MEIGETGSETRVPTEVDPVHVEKVPGSRGCSLEPSSMRPETFTPSRGRFERQRKGVECSNPFGDEPPPRPFHELTGRGIAEWLICNRHKSLILIQRNKLVSTQRHALVDSQQIERVEGPTAMLHPRRDWLIPGSPSIGCRAPTAPLPYGRETCSRTHRERLLARGFLQEVIKGSYVPSHPYDVTGESTA